MRFWLDLLSLWLVVCAALLAGCGQALAAAMTALAAPIVRYLGCVAEGAVPPELRRWLGRPQSPPVPAGRAGRTRSPTRTPTRTPARLRLRGRGVAFYARKKLRLRRI